ncbi:MAG: UDP-N-acetylglucosamine 2-epimerase (non-hydrolyzing) [Bacteroidota bacterium]
MKKVLFVFGTRPEAIKMAPVIKAFVADNGFEVKVCVTAQHRQMLDQVLDFFEINPEFDLDLMKENQNLYQLSADVIVELKPVFESYKPDYVFVHGDTTTSTMAALAAYYAGAKVCHVEAGLRTYNKQQPFPEEINRQLTARIADLHFAPTQTSRANLLNEHIAADSIFVTGNTVIDALHFAKTKVETINDEEIETLKQLIDPGKRLILVTGHRRENFGEGFVNICNALQQISAYENVEIVYPVHFNPNVYDVVYELLAGKSNIKLIKPLSYPAFVWLMKRAYLILTDSGGIQEEAPALGIPVMVMRNSTERPEALEAGTVILVGTDKDNIIANTHKLLTDKALYEKMSIAANPYGDGTASVKILEHLKAYSK